MPECPTFLSLPARSVKPRARGITHVLDSGLTPEATRAFLGQIGHLVDIVKVGWGISYVDPTLPARTAICAEFERFSGSQFDPRVVKEFLTLLEAGVGEAEPELLAELISEVREPAAARAAVH